MQSKARMLLLFVRWQRWLCALKRVGEAAVGLSPKEMDSLSALHLNEKHSVSIFAPDVKDH